MKSPRPVPKQALPCTAIPCHDHESLCRVQGHAGLVQDITVCCGQILGLRVCAEKLQVKGGCAEAVEGMRFFWPNLEGSKEARHWQSPNSDIRAPCNARLRLFHHLRSLPVGALMFLRIRKDSVLSCTAPHLFRKSTGLTASVKAQKVRMLVSWPVTAATGHSSPIGWERPEPRGFGNGRCLGG